MASSQEIVDYLLASPSGNIVCLNLLGGVEAALYTREFARDVLRYWGEYVFQTGKTSLELAFAIGDLPDLLAGSRPAAFAPPATSLGDCHICDRRDDRETPGEERATVKEAYYMMKWAAKPDLEGMQDNGIEVAAKPGTLNYRRTMKNLQKTKYRRSVATDPAGQSITNPAKGSNGILFYTRASELLPGLDAQEESKRADFVRDVLGLVHMNTRQQVVLVFQSRPAEERPDRGRPNVIDAGGNTRFLSHPPGTAGNSEWGLTADMSKVCQAASSFLDIGGRPERVCGVFPKPSQPALRLDVRFLGAPALPRGDTKGVFDPEFAALLAQGCSTSGGLSLSDRLIELLSGVA